MESKTVNTPSTEGKAPENITTSTTTATTKGTTPATSAATTNTSTTSTAASLPADYLTGGYFRGEDKKRYTDPDLVY